MLRIKKDVELTELENFGFEKNYSDQYVYLRKVNGKILYMVYITQTHHNIQVEVMEHCKIAQSLQLLIMKLTQAGIIEEVEGEEYGD